MSDREQNVTEPAGPTELVPKSNGRWLVLLTCLLAATTLIITFSRLNYAIDFSDEAFYVATAQRWQLDIQMYVDEINFSAGASWLAGLWLKLRPYEWFGPVLWVRIGYWLLLLSNAVALIASHDCISKMRTQCCWAYRCWLRSHLPYLV